jgi:cytochrome c553
MFRITLLALLPLLCGCGTDMWTRSKVMPLEPNPTFPDGNSSRPLVADTVARGHAELDTAYYQGRVNGRLVDTFPYPVTRQMLDRGQERFDIYCSPCHGKTGAGNGVIVQRGFSPPPSYYSPRLLQEPVGHFYDVITNGYGAMYSYNDRVEPQDRWAIAAYIRALQLSSTQGLSGLSPEEQRRLTAMNSPTGHTTPGGKRSAVGRWANTALQVADRQSEANVTSKGGRP